MPHLESGILFVTDGPTSSEHRRLGKKKRARLVTACDACRTKKIKCIQSVQSSICEACRATDTNCVYGDRERYHAIKGISAQGSQMPLPWNIHARPTSDSARNNPILTTSAPSRRISSKPPGPRSVHGNPSKAASHTTQKKRSFSTVNYTQSQFRLSHPESTALFDPDDPQYPRHDLLEHLSELFIDHLVTHIPCWNLKSLRSCIKAKTLQPLLANSIASLASRFSNRPEFKSDKPKYLVGEPFLQMAKLLAVSLVSWPTLEILQGIILIAWAEYGSSRDSGLFMFTRMAVAMLQDLGYADPTVITAIPNEEEKDILGFIWFSVYRLDLASAWASGRPPCLHDPQQIEALPFRTKDVSNPSQRNILYTLLTELFSLRDAITKVMNGERDESTSHLAIISNIQNRITDFYRSIPPAFAFHKETLKALNKEKNGALLILLHLAFHGSNIVIHWPNLFNEFKSPISHSLDIAYASSIAIADVIRITQELDPVSLLTNPFIDLPVTHAVRVLMAAPDAFGNNLRKTSLYCTSKNEQALALCVGALRDMSRYWAPTTISNSLMKRYEEAWAKHPPAQRFGTIIIPPKEQAITSHAPSLATSSTKPSPYMTETRSTSITPPFPQIPLPLACEPPPNASMSLFVEPYASAADEDVFNGFFEQSMLNDDWNAWDMVMPGSGIGPDSLAPKNVNDTTPQWLRGLHEPSECLDLQEFNNVWAQPFESYVPVP